MEIHAEAGHVQNQCSPETVTDRSHPIGIGKFLIPEGLIRRFHPGFQQVQVPEDSVHEASRFFGMVSCFSVTIHVDSHRQVSQ